MSEPWMVDDQSLAFSVPVRVLLVVLSQQVLAIVVPVRSPHDAVDVLARGFPPLYARHVDRTLVVEFDEDDRALDPIVVGAVRPHLSDLGKMRFVEMLAHLIRLHPGMTVPQIPDMPGDEVQQLSLWADDNSVARMPA